MSLASEVVSEVTGDVAGLAIPPLHIVHIVKVAFATTIILVMIGLGFSSWYLFGELKQANEKIGSLTSENAKLKGDLETIKVTQAVMSAGQLVTDKGKEAVDKHAREVRTQLVQREQQIDHMPVAPEDKMRLKAEARMSSVWDTFCHLQPTNTVCQQQGFKIEASP